MKKSLLLLIVAAGIVSTCFAADSTSASSSPSPSPAVGAVSPKPKPTPTPGPLSPATLPGNGLAQHDFFYAGEAHTEDMYIVRKGQITWEYHVPNGKPEISDAVLLSNGDVLFAHMSGVTEINQDKQVVWNYDAPAGTQIHTAQPIGHDRVLYIQNGPEPAIFVVNKVTGKTELHLPIQAGDPKNVHPQFRHARLTPAGTLIVAHMDMKGLVREYDEKGNIVWSWTAPSGRGPWGVEREANGNTLVSDGGHNIYEVNPKGDVVWQFTQADAPAYLFWSTQNVYRLANGNTLLVNWFNQWNGTPDPNDLPLQAIEVTPDKKVAWALRSWNPPAALGPATTIQVLDDPGVVPENVHFGDIR
jgi:hypothetical protein